MGIEELTFSEIVRVASQREIISEKNHEMYQELEVFGKRDEAIGRVLERYHTLEHQSYPHYISNGALRMKAERKYEGDETGMWVKFLEERKKPTLRDIISGKAEDRGNFEEVVAQASEVSSVLSFGKTLVEKVDRINDEDLFFDSVYETLPSIGKKSYALPLLRPLKIAANYADRELAEPFLEGLRRIAKIDTDEETKLNTVRKYLSRAIPYLSRFELNRELVETASTPGLELLFDLIAAVVRDKWDIEPLKKTLSGLSLDSQKEVAAIYEMGAKGTEAMELRLIPGRVPQAKIDEGGAEVEDEVMKTMTKDMFRPIPADVREWNRGYGNKVVGVVESLKRSDYTTRELKLVRNILKSNHGQKDFVSEIASNLRLALKSEREASPRLEALEEMCKLRALDYEVIEQYRKSREHLVGIGSAERSFYETFLDAYFVDWAESTRGKKIVALKSGMSRKFTEFLNGIRKLEDKPREYVKRKILALSKIPREIRMRDLEFGLDLEVFTYIVLKAYALNPEKAEQFIEVTWEALDYGGK